MSYLRKRLQFPETLTEDELTCPHCKSGAVEVFADGILWSHECGAYGYYDDGDRLFPDAQFRVKGT